MSYDLELSIKDSRRNKRLIQCLTLCLHEGYTHEDIEAICKKEVRDSRDKGRWPSDCSPSNDGKVVIDWMVADENYDDEVDEVTEEGSCLVQVE